PGRTGAPARPRTADPTPVGPAEPGPAAAGYGGRAHLRAPGRGHGDGAARGLDGRPAPAYRAARGDRDEPPAAGAPGSRLAPRRPTREGEPDRGRRHGTNLRAP